MNESKLLEIPKSFVDDDKFAVGKKKNRLPECFKRYTFRSVLLRATKYLHVISMPAS